jgi:hypothetical protein
MQTLTVAGAAIAVIFVLFRVVGWVWSRKIADDVMLETFGDVPYVEGER